MKTSPYYPPRAGPLSRAIVMLTRISFLTSRWLGKPPTIHVGSVFQGGIPWLLVPGLMWRQEGMTKRGNGVIMAWSVLVTIHIFSLNPDLAGTSAIIASVLHALSAAAVLTALHPHWQGTARLWRTSLFSMLLVLMIYTVGLRMVVLPFAQRVSTPGTTVMIHKAGWLSKHQWIRGEWVAYRRQGSAIYMDRILAIPGDTVRFHPESFEVNGRLFDRLSAQMPTNGEIEMDAGTYFIWPTDATFSGVAPEVILGLTIITEPAIFGRPYRRWFWTTHSLEDLKPVPSPTP